MGKNVFGTAITKEYIKLSLLIDRKYIDKHEKWIYVLGGVNFNFIELPLNSKEPKNLIQDTIITIDVRHNTIYIDYITIDEDIETAEQIIGDDFVDIFNFMIEQNLFPIK
jgi:hypothetical protein